jgi:hypothetical protein
VSEAPDLGRCWRAKKISRSRSTGIWRGKFASRGF